MTAGGLVWMYDARSWMTDLAVDIGGGAEGRFFMDAAIGAYYPFLREDFTPYLGAQVRWAEMKLGGQGAGGLVLQPTVGMLLGRLSSVQVRAEVGYFINTFGEVESTIDPRTGRRSHSLQPGIRLLRGHRVLDARGRGPGPGRGRSRRRRAGARRRTR